MKAKFLSVLLALTMVLSLLPTAALAEDKTVSTEEELKQAIESVSDGDTITVSGTIEVNAPLVVKNTVTLTGGSIVASDTFSSTSGDFTKYNLISLQTPEKTLTLKDIILDAKGKTLVVYCNAGKVVVDGATITGGKTSSYVAGVYMTSASQFEMNSGSITGNEVGDSFKNNHYTQYASDLWIGANANGALTSINGGKIGNIFVNSNEWSEKNPGSLLTTSMLNTTRAMAQLSLTVTAQLTTCISPRSMAMVIVLKLPLLPVLPIRVAFLRTPSRKSAVLTTILLNPLLLLIRPALWFY